MQNENLDERSNVMILNLRDLFFYLLSKWAYILAALVIGGILGGLVFFVQMKKSTGMSPEEIIENLDESKINKEQVKQYADFMALYNQQVEYEENSYLQNLDPNTAWTGKVTYFASCDDNGIEEIESRFNNILNVEGRKQELLSVSGLDCSEQAFSELFYVEFNLNSSNAITINDKKLTENSGVFSVEFVAADEQTCKKVMDTVQEIVTEETGEIEKSYSGCTVDIVGKQIAEGRNESLAKSQYESLNLRKTYLSEATNLKGKFTEDELTYYRYHYENELPDAQEKAGLSKKKTVLGAVVAVFVALLTICVIYLLNGRIKSKDDVSVVYGLPILAYLDNEKHPVGFGKLISRWKNRKLAMANNPDYLISVLSTKDLSKCLLIADLSDDTQKKIADEILVKDGRFECKGLLGKQGDAVAALQQCDGAILMLELWKTKRAEIERELEILKHMGKEVLGTVIIKSE